MNLNKVRADIGKRAQVPGWGGWALQSLEGPRQTYVQTLKSAAVKTASNVRLLLLAVSALFSVQSASWHINHWGVFAAKLWTCPRHVQPGLCNDGWTSSQLISSSRVGVVLLYLPRRIWILVLLYLCGALFYPAETVDSELVTAYYHSLLELD